MKAVGKTKEKMKDLRVADAVSEVWNIFKRCNKYVDETAPWVLAKDEGKKDRLDTVLYNLTEAITIGASLLYSFMAIKEFQARNNEVVDGFLGPGTRAALNNPKAQAFGLVLGDTSDTVTQVQKLLSKWGYLTADSVTGYYGDATQQAVKDFQDRNGLSSDGSVGSATMRSAAARRRAR